MNIVFWLLLIIALVALWFLLAFVFRPVGRFVFRVFSDVKDIVSQEDAPEEENKKEGVSNER